jgi:hypothetical protein
MQQQPTFDPPSSTPSIDILTSAIRGATDNVTPNDGVEDISILSDNLGQLALNPSEYRFFGKSSGAMLIQAAMELKQEYAQLAEPPVSQASQNKGFTAPRPEFWAPYEVCCSLAFLFASFISKILLL